MTEQEFEQAIQKAGLTAPRITPERIDATIVSVDYHVFPDSLHTVCCLKLVNGFTVIGDSACASPENFNARIGREVAYSNARNKIWQLEGYLLKTALALKAIPVPETPKAKPRKAVNP